MKVLTLFGTRPEGIKLAPVMRALERHNDSVETINVSSSQHTSLLRPFTATFDIRIDHDLQVMKPNQTPDLVCSRVLASLNPLLTDVKPDLMLVQGDTTTALAGANRARRAAFKRQKETWKSRSRGAGSGIGMTVFRITRWRARCDRLR